MFLPYIRRENSGEGKEKAGFPADKYTAAFFVVFVLYSIFRLKKTVDILSENEDTIHAYKQNLPNRQLCQPQGCGLKKNG